MEINNNQRHGHTNIKGAEIKNEPEYIPPHPIITIPLPHILPLKEAINNVSVVPQQLLCGHFQCPAPMISTHGELGGKHTTHTNYFDTCHCVSK